MDRDEESEGGYSYRVKARNSAGFIPQSYFVDTVSLPPAERYRVEQQQDDYARGSYTTGSMAVNGLSQGELELTGDQDCLSEELVSGRTYWV